MSSFIPERMVAEIRKQERLRTPGLAAVFHMSLAEVEATLDPLCAPGGPLVSCDIVIGAQRVKEYRCSTIGGGKLKEIGYSGATRPKPKTESVPFGDPKGLNKAIAERFQTPAGGHLVNVPPTAAGKESNPTMTTTDRIIETLAERGPMTAKELRRHIPSNNVSMLCAQLVRQGRVVRLGGGERSSIYGVKGQSLAPQTPRSAPKSVARPGDGRHTIGAIETHVPPPEKQGALRQAISELRPGESRLISGYLLNNIYRAAQRSHIKIQTRKEEGGFRVWRAE